MAKSRQQPSKKADENSQAHQLPTGTIAAVNPTSQNSDTKPTNLSNTQKIASEPTGRQTRVESAPASATTTPLSGQFGRYKILKTLGQGGMGAVYLAKDSQLGRKVALKVPQFESKINQEILDRFYREARSAATLQHPGICPVFDVGEINGTHYISMAYIEGRPLEDFIRPDKPMKERAAAIIIRNVAIALEEAHSHGVVHRDLKPANVMIDTRKNPVVMDFGLAIQLDPAQDSRVTRTGMLLGTPAYMPPERMRGNVDNSGAEGDIYSLGVMLYELLSGQLPFQGSTILEMASEVLTKTAPRLSEYRIIGGKLEAICSKMMEKDPAKRYGSMKDVAKALTDFLKHGDDGGQTTTVDASTSPTSDGTEEELQEFFANQSIVTGEPTSSEIAPTVLYRTQARKRKGGNNSKFIKIGILSAVAGLVLLLGTVFLLKTDKGTLRIEVDDPSISLSIDGEEVGFTEKEVELKPGEHGLAVKVGKTTIDLDQQSRITTNGEKVVIRLGDVELSSDKFTVVKGENPVMKITLVDPPQVADATQPPSNPVAQTPKVNPTPTQKVPETQPDPEVKSITADGIRILHDISIKRLVPGATVAPGADYSMITGVPPEVLGRNFTQRDGYQGIMRFEILESQKVYLGVTGREWGGGGNPSGGWQKELVSRETLEKQGWKEVFGLKLVQDEKRPHPPVTVFVRDCQAGEKWNIRTHKYHAPLVIWGKPNEPTASANFSGEGIPISPFLRAKQVPKDFALDVMAFTGPSGDGRRGSAGFMVESRKHLKGTGTRFSFDFQRSASGYGFQIVHPFRDGHVFINVHNSVGIQNGGSWGTMGWRDPETDKLIATDAAKEVLPIKSATEVNVVSELSEGGDYLLLIDDVVVAKQKIETAKPLVLEIPEDGKFPLASSWDKTPFAGENFAPTLKPGHAGLIISPCDQAPEDHSFKNIRLSSVGLESATN